MFGATAAAADYNINSGAVTITASGTHTITGTGSATGNVIIVNENVVATITLNNVNISTSGNAVYLKSGAKVNLILADGSVNTLTTTGARQAALRVPSGTELIIDGSGILNVTGGTYAGAIGGNAGANNSSSGGTGGTGESTGNITIDGGNINITAGAYGAGIGGGAGGNGGAGSGTTAGGNGGNGGNTGSIIVNDGIVKVSGGVNSIGIGGGNGGNGGIGDTPFSGYGREGGNGGSGGNSTFDLNGGTVEINNTNYGVSSGSGGNGGNSADGYIAWRSGKGGNGGNSGINTVNIQTTSDLFINNVQIGIYGGTGGTGGDEGKGTGAYNNDGGGDGGKGGNVSVTFANGNVTINGSVADISGGNGGNGGANNTSSNRPGDPGYRGSGGNLTIIINNQNSDIITQGKGFLKGVIGTSGRTNSSVVDGTATVTVTSGSLLMNTTGNASFVNGTGTTVNPITFDVVEKINGVTSRIPGSDVEIDAYNYKAQTRNRTTPFSADADNNSANGWVTVWLPSGSQNFDFATPSSYGYDSLDNLARTVSSGYVYNTADHQIVMADLIEITFDPNGGAFPDGTSGVENGVYKVRGAVDSTTAVPVPAANPAFGTPVFAGWYETTDSNHVVSNEWDDTETFADMASGSVRTLYAGYKVNVTNTLTNVTSDNSAVSVMYGESYSAELSAVAGHTLNTGDITVTMGGIDITAGNVSGTAVTIAAVTGNVVITAGASLNSYSITNSLTNATNSNTDTSITHGSSYSGTITAIEGHTLGAITVTMNGSDITGTAVSDNTVSISSVTGNLVITADASLNSYSITNSLTNATNSNTDTSITHGSSYSGTITAAEGHTLGAITVTMNGSDITSTAVSDNTVSVFSVTGDLVITTDASLGSYTLNVSVDGNDYSDEILYGTTITQSIVEDILNDNNYEIPEGHSIDWANATGLGETMPADFHDVELKLLANTYSLVIYVGSSDYGALVLYGADINQQLVGDILDENNYEIPEGHSIDWVNATGMGGTMPAGSASVTLDLLPNSHTLTVYIDSEEFSAGISYGTDIDQLLIESIFDDEGYIVPSGYSIDWTNATGLDTTMPDDDHEVELELFLTPVEVIFNANGGNFNGDLTKSVPAAPDSPMAEPGFGTDLTAPANMQLAGWSENEYAAAADFDFATTDAYDGLILYAVWEEIPQYVKIIFNATSGTFLDIPGTTEGIISDAGQKYTIEILADSVIPELTDVTLNPPASADLEGWVTEDGILWKPGDGGYTVEYNNDLNDFTLYAVWSTDDAVFVTFDATDGYFIVDGIKEKQTAFEIKVPESGVISKPQEYPPSDLNNPYGYVSPRNYELTGWYLDGIDEGWNFDETIEENMTLSAGWKLAANSGGGSPTGKAIIVDSVAESYSSNEPMQGIPEEGFEEEIKQVSPEDEIIEIIEEQSSKISSWWLLLLLFLILLAGYGYYRYRMNKENEK